MNIYFIRAGKTKAVKIGSAASEQSVRARMQILQTGNHQPLHLIALITAGYCSEGGLHRRFAKQHIRGEWFRLEGDLALLLADLPAPEDTHGQLRATIIDARLADKHGLSDSTIKYHFPKPRHAYILEAAARKAK
jgi:Meiotically up-regulated gene 113